MVIETETDSGVGVGRLTTSEPTTSEVVDLTAPLSPTEEAALEALDPTIGGSAGPLASGVPCRAVLLAVLPLDAKTMKGEDATGLILSVTVVGQPPHQAQVGVYVPPEARYLLVAGRDLPGSVTAGGNDAVTIDWVAALAESSGAQPSAAPEAGFHVDPGAVQAAPADTAGSPQPTVDLQPAGPLTASEPGAAESEPSQSGELRVVVAPSSMQRGVAARRLSADELLELSALISAMNQLYLRAMTALDGQPDACAELSAQWTCLHDRALELVPYADSGR
jgi:hypothetical protein